MGQYYTPIIKRGKKFKGYYSHHYNNGLKLIEHSYVGNEFTETVMAELFDNPGKLAWVGDYAEEKDVKSEFTLQFIQAEKRFGRSFDLGKNNYSKPIYLSKPEYRYIINYDKNEYIDMEEYCKMYNRKDFILHPVPLLTAIGNGRGGGDYYGSNMKLIGYWACDTIMTTNDLEKDKNSINITDKLNFGEC